MLCLASIAIGESQTCPQIFPFWSCLFKEPSCGCTCNLWPAEYSSSCLSKYCTALSDLGVNSLGCLLLGKWATVLNIFHWWIIFLIIRWWFGNGLLTLHRLMLQSSNLPKPLLFRGAHTCWWSIYQPHLISNSCLLLTFLVSVELVQLYLIFF